MTTEFDIDDDTPPEVDPQIAEETARVNAMYNLMNSEGWKMLTEILMDRILVEELEMDKPLVDNAGVYQQEFRKGSLNALRATINTPNIVYETAKEQLKHLTRNEDDE